MKNQLLFWMTLISFSLSAQNVIDSLSTNHSYWQISPRIGYDVVPIYQESFEYIDYEGAIEWGISVNRYWEKWGFQVDFDHITNTPVLDKISSPVWVNYPSNPTQYNLLVNKEKVSRWAFVAGPSYKFERPNFSWENALMAGIGKVTQGEFLATADTDPTTTINDFLISYHSGYRDAMVFTTKFQTRFNYFFNYNFGIHFGAYYIHHFNVLESKENKIIDNYFNTDTDLYYASGHTEDFDTSSGVINAFNGEYDIRGDNQERACCAREISSIGLFAGLSFRLGNNAEKSKCPNCIYCEVCGNYHLPPQCCSTCDNGCTLSIIAKDKFTGKVLQDTDVLLKNSSGQAVNTGTTNSMGVVIFQKVKQDDYTIEGKLFEVALEPAQVSYSEFEQCLAQGGGVIEKEILYGDENFILQGKVVECNSAITVPGATIILKDKKSASIQNTISNSDGKYIFHLKQVSEYELSAEKDGYYTPQPFMINSGDFDRNTTLTINFEMCIDPCGKAVVLDNIQFDVDKWEILPDAEPDLYRVLQIMQLNPNVRVKMSSHTDSRASDAYNDKLSQRRADATLNWLVAHGADRSRLSAKGMGERQLLNTKCQNGVPCTDDEHRINRRTDFTVECITND